MCDLRCVGFTELSNYIVNIYGREYYDEYLLTITYVIEIDDK